MSAVTGLTPERVVVVGYGPVASRLVDELLPAVRAGKVELLVLGEEERPAYNRVLVAEVAVGRTTPEAITLADPTELSRAGVQVELGVRVGALDRERRQVLLSDGRTARYDRLVLATGARAAVPSLAGIRPTEDRLPTGVTALRDLADAARLRAAVRERRRIVVLGGGILGLEAALAASEEGADVTLVHSGPGPMARQLDRGGASVLTAALRAQGVRVIAGARAAGVTTEPGPDGLPRFRALVLDDGTEVEGEALLLSCGVRPRVELARAAGLQVITGVVVDHELRADPEGRVLALGDCAEIRCSAPGCTRCTGHGPSGLIGPGWRQAEWLAARLTAAAGAGAGGAGAAGGAPAGADADAGMSAEGPGVILLKSRSVDLAAAGNVAPEPWDVEDDPAGAPPVHVAQWADPQHGRYVKMVTRDGVLEGMVCVGMPRTAAELVLLFERRAELPADRTSLLRLDAADEPAVAASGPERTVCRCTGATLGSIDEAIGPGCDTVAAVGRATRAGTGCGGCHSTIRERLAAWGAAQAAKATAATATATASGQPALPAGLST
ncbi:FAD-dependent oxidoreductase [Georgenia wangjunii]|uniref:FAD-dependent oxidoreductase n=1 Tax=Georgenia wangjunii TaxID=3117730 RepID=UPI002F26D059